MSKILKTICLLAAITMFLLGCQTERISNANESVENIVHSNQNTQYIIDANLIKSIQAFSVNQTETLFADNENMCYSPLSLYHGLSMLSCGTNNHSLAQIMEVLGIDDVDAHHQNMRKLYQSLYHRADQHNFLIANAVWTNKNVDVKEVFKRIIAENYFGVVNSVDFSDPSKVAKVISEWIADNTDQMIKPEVIVYSGTIAMLVNAMYLSDTWCEGFEERFTHEDAFYMSDNKTATATYMQKTEYGYPFRADDNAVYVSLPLKNIGEMVFILPNKDIDSINLSACIENYINNKMPLQTADKMSIKIPQMSIDCDLMLKDYLNGIGIDDPYFIADSVSEVRQGTALELNEYGIKAAAYMSIRADSLPYEGNDMFEFHLNRPFVFMVISHDKIPVLIGKMVSP